MKTTTECSYLEGGGAEGLGGLRQVLLYHSQDSRGRAVWGLYMPADTRQAASACALASCSVDPREARESDSVYTSRALLVGSLFPNLIQKLSPSVSAG